jgi:hypothetical protein
MSETTVIYSTQAQLPGENALVLLPEAYYVTETPTGLVFRPDTPLEVWSGLMTRLLTQHKKIEWAIADAINFGDRCYGEVYSQWVEETGLAKKTLANIAWVGRSIESSRRREDVDFSYHAEVAPLPPPDQDRLLEKAVDQGWRRYDLREAVKSEQASRRGKAVNAEGEPVCAAELAWVPDISDLTDEARQALERQAPLGRLRTAWTAGALWALVWAGNEDAFLPERYRP